MEPPVLSGAGVSAAGTSAASPATTPPSFAARPSPSRYTLPSQPASTRAPDRKAIVRATIDNRTIPQCYHPRDDRGHCRASYLSRGGRDRPSRRHDAGADCAGAPRAARARHLYEPGRSARPRRRPIAAHRVCGGFRRGRYSSHVHRGTRGERRVGPGRGRRGSHTAEARCTYLRRSRRCDGAHDRRGARSSVDERASHGG